MDVLTPKGLQTLQQERRAAQVFEAYYPSFTYTPTPKDKPIAFDAFLHSKKLLAIVETKCRSDMTYEIFRRIRHSEWLVTQSKINHCVALAKAWNVSFCGFLYLPLDDILLVETIWKNGRFVVRCHAERCKTQRTINGGEAIRLNAFIDMSKAAVLFGRELI